MDRVCIRRLTFAHFRFRIVDLVGQFFVLRVEVERLLPRIQGFSRFIQFRAGISDMFKHNRIGPG